MILMKNIFIFAFFILTMITSFAHAQNIEIRAVGTIPYDGSFFSSEPSDADKKKAIESAKINAWKKYVATFSGAKQNLVMANQEAVNANLDNFITEPVIIDKKVDPNLKTYSVVVRIGINAGMVDQFLERQSVGVNGSAGAGGAPVRSKDSLFSFLFMARKASSIRQFDARQTKIQEASTSASTDDNGGVTARSTKTTGGSTLKKADDVSYSVSSSQDIDSAMGQVLNTSNIEYAGYDDVVANCNGPAVSQFKNEFVNNDELAPQTRSKIISAARDCGVKYFAYGTIDTEMSDVDSVSGSQRVYVSVRSQLWDISQKLPRKIGSIGPIQYSGLGPNQNVAGRNALALAAKETARGIVDQLNAKGIR